MTGQRAMNDENPERRRFPRVACRAAVQYRDLLKPGSHSLGGLTKNVSLGGLQFETAEFFPSQHRLLMELRVPGASEGPVRTIVQVVWTRKQAHGDRYDTGAQFLGIESRDHQILADYLQHASPAALE